MNWFGGRSSRKRKNNHVVVICTVLVVGTAFIAGNVSARFGLFIGPDSNKYSQVVKNVDYINAYEGLFEARDLLMKNYNGDIILVSHNRDEIFKFCESLVVIDRGSVVTAGKTREIFKNPLTIASARLTGCKNISPIKHINDYELEACDWGIILKTEEKIESNITHVGIRGHNLQPSINKEQINTMKIELVQFTETAFEVQYLVKNAEVSEINNIWWMEKKKESDRDIKNNIADYLTFPSDKLILLKDK